MPEKKIVILGGGPAGMAAAWKLAASGEEVIVLEKESSVGGLCRTITYNYYFFDLGGHRFTKDEELGAQIQGLMGDELMVSPRRSVIRLQKKYFEYPLEFKNLFSSMKKTVLVKSIIDYAYAVTAKKLFNRPDISFEDWVTNRFGKTLYDIYFGIYTQQIWGIPPSEISADWAAQRISLLNLWDVLLRLLGKEDDHFLFGL